MCSCVGNKDNGNTPETRCTGCGALNWSPCGHAMYKCDYCGSNYGHNDTLWDLKETNANETLPNFISLEGGDIMFANSFQMFTVKRPK